MDAYIPLIILAGFLIQNWRTPPPALPTPEIPALEDHRESVLTAKQLNALKCRCCGLNLTDSELLKKLEALVRLYPDEVVITSGTRCAKHNVRVGGVPKSLHLTGRAVDVACAASKQLLMGRCAAEAGFRIVIPYPSKGYLHLSL
ncbi:MAG: D-Ala-D-Ala carboxypeptidase family metallohydrolase [Pyramidobacter sp.]|nr:D-Ala-D-Ala carboxypeptidase family metallohydrolase [Pyramidobacter sp.]